MHSRFWFVVAFVAAVIAVAAATTTTQAAKTDDEDDNQAAVSETETTDNEHALHSRDEGGSSEDDSDGGDDEHADDNGRLGESSLAAGKGNEHEGEYENKNDNGDEVEADWEIVVENNNDKNRGSYNDETGEIAGSWKLIQAEPYGKHKNTVVYETSEKNAYETKQQPKSEYGEHHLSELAQVIPFQQQNALTLNQIYGRVYNNKQKHDAYGSSYNNQRQILALLKFGRDFESWNPRNNNSQWQWFGSAKGGAQADNAAYIVHHDEDDGSYEKHNSVYDDGPKKTKDRSYVEQYSLPYKKYYTSSDPNNRYAYYEGVALSKTNFSIEPTERFLYRLKFSCKVLNADKNPFPPSQVSNAWNDPRLATCGHGITDNDSGLFFFVRATNTGVWAQYGRFNFPNQRTAQSFFTQRLVGRRARYDEVIDSAVEIDRRENKVNYYLNGYSVWTIYAIGVLPPDDGVNVLNRGEGVPQIRNNISSVRLNFGTYKNLNTKDPNNRRSTQRLIKVRGNSPNYRANDTFYDENNLKRNQLWGQGTIMTLLKLIVLKAESSFIHLHPQRVLPGIYGAAERQPRYYQQASPYEDQQKMNFLFDSLSTL